ncbi:hypothetical protein VZ95_14790 [Elstera litoralis]|uniref:Uncharacterized protein n=1 Tax=Elstera litoralis TaxID=552518 RepID=A0A0F3IQ81_9PROT|nr:hypothetical protein VZ95_14790 [Elstera litoralis]
MIASQSMKPVCTATANECAVPIANNYIVILSATCDPMAPGSDHNSIRAAATIYSAAYRRISERNAIVARIGVHDIVAIALR